jgi:two-component system, NarL family, response regulator LiaR
MIRVLLADDHPTTRAGVRTILQAAPDIQIVGETDNGNDVRQLVAELRPDILLLDLIMPDLRPAKLVRWVRENYPETITLILTAYDRDAYLAAMLEAGAAGFITKDERAEQLLAAIRLAASEEILFNSAQLARARRWREEAGSKWERLTERERETLQLLAEGLDNHTIAETLAISSKTVAYHVTNILGKLGVKSRHEAIAWLHKYAPEGLE